LGYELGKTGGKTTKSGHRSPIDQRILNLAREKGIDVEEAARILRRAHILLEHEKDRIIWVRCVS